MFPVHVYPIHDMKNTKSNCPEQQAIAQEYRRDYPQQDFCHTKGSDLIKGKFTGIQQCKAIKY